MTRDRTRWLLAATVLGAVLALVLVTGWLLTDPGSSRADALKTGGLAGGSILAIYGLWINDRRRRTEEARHAVERGRAAQDREKVSDERFAKAVELLGHQADQVRVGAMHALAALARSRPGYTQTVLDVLCAYLRRPFTHPDYQVHPDDPHRVDIEPDETWPPERLAEVDRERQVRLTAQRLIAGLLPATKAEEATSTTPPLYDLDLTSASLEYLNLAERHIGALTARRARFYGITRFAGIRTHQRALFSSAVFHGRTDLYSAAFDGGLSLLNARFGGQWRMAYATARDFVDLRTPAPDEQVGELAIIGPAEVKLDEETGWQVELPAYRPASA
jgi:hypothetical protein